MEELEPWSPRAIYLVAHHATWSGAYFQRVLRAARLATHPDPALARYRQKLVQALTDERAYAATLVRTADQLARAHGLDIPPTPRLPDEWQTWVTGILSAFRAQIDLAVPTNASLTFGFDHGQARATLAVLVTLGELQRHGLDVTDELVSGMKSIEALAHRWPGSASLMARAPDTGDLLLAWAPVHGALSTFGQADVSRLDARGLVALATEATTLLTALGELEQLALSELAPDT